MLDIRKTLLIVDDDISILTVLSQHFSELGYCVRSVKDGSSAMSEIENELPDILLSDINPPGIPGVQFLSTVRRKFPSVRVVAMSGALSEGLMPPGIAADAFYEKDSSLHLLTQIVDSMTQPDRSTVRLATNDLFGFQVFENIPSHPGVEPSTTSTENSIAFLFPPPVRRLEQRQEREELPGIRQEVISVRDSDKRA